MLYLFFAQNWFPLRAENGSAAKKLIDILMLLRYHARM